MIVLKFPFPERLNKSINVLQMPKEAIILKVAFQNDIICIWAQCKDFKNLNQERKFLVLGTGVEALIDPTKTAYLETLQDNSAVWHIYEVVE